MKKLVLIMLAVLTASALAYKLPTAWTLGGGLGTDSMRITIYRPGSANTVLTTVKDTGFTTPLAADKTGGNRTFNVDSLMAHTIRYMYFVAPDTFREYVQDVFPVEMGQYLRAYLADLDTATLAIRDSMYEASQTGTLTLDQEDIDSISAAVVRGVNTAAGTGVNAVTLYARDTINNAFVSGVYITAVGGVDNLNATTGVNGFATFNCNTATYTFSALGSPYTWVPFTRAIAGNITDTITGGGVLVVASTAPEMCTVYGQIDRNGTAAQGVWVEITLTRPDTLTIDSSFIELKTKVVTNSSGLWSADVYYLTGDTRNFYYTYKDAYGRVLTFRPTTTGSHNVRNILVDKP